MTIHCTAPLPSCSSTWALLQATVWAFKLHLCPHLATPQRQEVQGQRENWGPLACGQISGMFANPSLPLEWLLCHLPFPRKHRCLLCICGSPFLFSLLGCCGISSIKGFLRPLHFCEQWCDWSKKQLGEGSGSLSGALCLQHKKQISCRGTKQQTPSCLLGSLWGQQSLSISWTG